MHRTALFISLFVVVINAFAQEQIQAIQRTQKHEFDTTLYHVHDYPTQEGVLSFFKPSEIIMRRKFDPEVSQKIANIHIQVLDSNHLVLRYFKYKASIQIRNKNFEHNVFPKRFNPAQVSSMNYIESPNHEKDILDVQLFPAAYMPRENVVHKMQSHRIQYYDVDGKVITKEEIPHLNLVMGTFEFGPTIYGKEAAEKYRDPKYAQGVQEILRIKKP